MSKRKKLIKSLKETYKFVVLNDDTFEEKASFKTTLWHLIIGTTAFAILLIIITITTIRYTPLREYLSGTTDEISKKNLEDAFTKIDSLSYLSNANAVYLNNLKNVINGNINDTNVSNPKDLSKASDSIKLN